MADVITLIVGAVTLYLVNLIVGIVAPYLVGKVAPEWVGKVAPILVGLFAAVAPHLLDPIGREMFNYHSNIKKLSEEVNKLQKVSEPIKAAWTNADEIDVEVWLKSVDGIIKNARKFLEDEKKENEGFFNRLCAWLNLKSWYQKSKKAKQTAAEIAPKIQEGNRLSSSAPPRKIKIPAVEGYEAFKSRMPILKKIMEALNNPNVNIIGVYGMGGTGKTMLANKVARKCEEEKLFDEVVMTVVSQPPNLRKIQGEIIDKLNLKLEKETESVRASLLSEELKKLLVDKKKSILVILDDIWKKLDLTEVGIPFKGNYRGCKILVTSRNRDVLSNEMGAELVFRIEVLPEEEAWDLFKKIAGDSIEHPDLHPTAIKVVKECGGLPIAIATVASALKNNENLHIWKNALRELTRSTPTNIGEMHPKVYRSLKLSYDFQSKEAKLLFLLCSLFPEDYQFSITDILKYGKGLGLFQEINALEEARDVVHTLVYKLKDSSLLLDNNPTGFRMHDVVRDVGIYVASEDEHMLIVKNDIDPEEQMTEEKLRNCRGISLPYSNVPKLPTGLKCPKLNFLLLFTNDPSLKIPETFFKGMKQLKVLSLTNMCFSSLPSSLRFLSNLRTLCLDDCVFQDIPRRNLARIGELKKLEVLSFESSDIEELPREIGQLTCLRLLDLRNCSKLKVIPPDVMANFSRLEDLYMERSFVRWEVDGNASLAELKRLSQLVTLDIHIPDTNILPKDLRFENLMRYRIFMGDGWDWYGDYETSRTLKLKLNTSIQQFGLNTLLERTEDLYLGEMNGIKNDLCSLNREGFPHLRHLHVQESCEIEYVINTSELFSDKAFPELRSLFLCNLINLKKICHGQFPPESFCNLRLVNVDCCDGLKNLFSISMVKSLLQLQKLKINECKIMDEIVYEGSEGSEGNNEAVGKIKFCQLRSLKLLELPNLTGFYSKKQTGRPFVNYTPTTDARPGEIISEDEHDIAISLFKEKIAFPNLEKLVIANVNLLKEIWKKDPQTNFLCQKLSSLQVSECGNLRSIFTTSMVKSLKQLQKLSIRKCEMVEEIVEEEGVQEQATDKIVFPQLTSLILEGLLQLKSFCQGSHISEWPSLKKLDVSGSYNVEIFALELSSFEEMHGKDHLRTPTKQPLFWVDKVAFPNLEELKLRSMSSMKEIWQDQYHASSFGKLRVLEVRDSKSVTHVLTFAIAKSLVQIKSIFVDNCKMMKEVIASEEGEETDETIFSQLNSLKLRNLPNLTSFCVGSNNFSFPSLEQVLVEKCPELKTFSHGILYTPKLDKVHVQPGNWREVLYKGFWKGDLNTTIQYLFEQKVEFLRLSELSELKQICYDQFPVEACYVRYLVVEKCTSLLNIVSSNMLESLWKLEKITVESCDSLEQVFDLEGLNCDEERAKLLPNLNEMNLIELPKLRCIWNKDPKGILSFHCQLRCLNIHKCDSLRNMLISPSMVPDLVRLEGLKITNCLNMEEIVKKEKGAKEEAIDKIVFGWLRNIILEDLPNLTSFYPGNRTLEFPYLRTMKIAGCPRTKTFTSTNEGSQKTFGDGNLDVPSAPLFINKKVEFPSLEELELKSLYSIKEIWQGQLHAESFCKLTTLTVGWCQSLTYLLPFAIAKSLVQIKCIIVDGCHMMEEIIASEEGEATDKTTLGQLNSLKLRKLSKLTSFCARSNTFSFPSLQQVLVEDCPELKTFSHGILHTPGLDKVHVLSDGWDEVKVLMDKGFWKGDLNTTIQYLFEQKVEFLRLSELSELKQICDDQFPVKACYVRYLVVEKCTSLLNVVSSNMLENLRKLVKITVESCDSLEQVFDLQGLDCNEKGLLCDLEEMNLTGLPKLRCIWNKDPKGILCFEDLRWINLHKCSLRFMLISPSMVLDLVGLEGFKITDCLNMEEIVEKERGAKEEAIDKIVFRCLRYIILYGLPNLTSFYPGNHTLVFPYLSTMKIACCPRIKTFTSTNEGLRESFGDGNLDVDSAPLFINNKVEFPSLEELELKSLHSIKEIWQGQLHAESFCQLTTLIVGWCQSLTYLLPFAIAKSLVQIKCIIVDGCHMMEEIIASEEGEATNKTTFGQLNSLKLRKLSKLTSFCAMSNTFSFPSLQQVLVENCPKLKTFSHGILHTRGLDKVHVLSDGWDEVKVLMDKGFWKGDLNTTIQYLFEQKVEFLRLSELSELKQICDDQFPVKACYVRYLVVEKCTSLLNVVSSNMLESLRKLERITVESCDSLEQVFDLEGLNCDEECDGLLPDLQEMNLTELPKLRCLWNKDPKGILSFRDLSWLKIHKCNSLRNLFSPFVALDLPLFKLKITDCLNVEEIVGKERGAKEEAIDKIVFRQLRYIILVGLRTLTSFYPGNRTLEFPYLRTMKIARCPRIKTFTSTNEGLQETFGDGNLDVASAPLFINNKVELPSLEELELKYLYSIKEIWQGQLHAESFCKLTTLTVGWCQSLTYLLPFAIAKSLVQIKCIIVDGCHMIEEIIASEEGEATDKTTFGQLNSLKLRKLSKLTSFCAMSNTFSFPSLQQVLVENCPELKTFSHGILHTPGLDRVHVLSDGWDEVKVLMDKGFWKEDLNTTIQYLFEQKVEFLRLSELSELKQICDDQFPVKACYIRYLVVEKCTSLLNVVSSNMLESLRKLVKITVESCDSLEQVFDLQGLDCNEKGLLCDLEEMNLTGLPKLRCIWNKDPKGILCFEDLRWINLHKCSLRFMLISPSMVLDLVRLEGFKITDCLNMEEIVEKERGAKEEAIDKIVFRRLRYIILYGLPNLTSFYPGNHTLVFPYLSTMKIAWCPRIKTFTSTNEGLRESFGDGNLDVDSAPLFINNKVEFPSLEELELKSLYSIKEIWQGQLHAESFCKLTTLTVGWCQSLTYLLPFAIVKSLVQIKCIIVDGCYMMEEIIASEEGEATNNTTFGQLNSLKLRKLPKLTSFCARSNTLSFPSLQQVLVENCPELKTFSHGILHTPKLDKVHVLSDGEYEVKVLLDKGFWKGDLNTTIQYLFEQKVEFLRLFELSELKQICDDQFPVKACYVRYLVVEKCTSLLNVVSSTMLESLQKLVKITMESCDSLEQVFDLEGLNCNEKGLLCDLEGMNLIELPKLRCIWNKDPKGILSFQHLRWLNLHKCSLRYLLISPSMVLDLVRLEGLRVTDCPNMEEIVEKERGAKEEAIDKIVFQWLGYIILEGLPNLISFYSGNHTLGFPQLKAMRIVGCPRIKTFTSTNEVSQETFGDGNLDIASAPVFINNKVAFHMLENLELGFMSSMREIWQRQFDASSFGNLRVLRVGKCDKILKVFPISLFQNFKNLEEVLVSDCSSLKEVFELGRVSSEVGHSQPIPIFQNLTTLGVRWCKSLTHLMPSTIAKSLLQIKRIDVWGCEMMKEIIANEEGEATDHGTTFNQLSSLVLINLPNLTSFYQGSNTFSFPLLERVLVKDCPKLKTFSTGILYTPKLEKVHTQSDNMLRVWDEGVWKGDLNLTIQHLLVVQKELPEEKGSSTAD